VIRSAFNGGVGVMVSNVSAQNKLRILIADDEKYVRALMKMELNLMGCDVVERLPLHFAKKIR